MSITSKRLISAIHYSLILVPYTVCSEVKKTNDETKSPSISDETSAGETEQTEPLPEQTFDIASFYAKYGKSTEKELEKLVEIIEECDA